MPAAGMAVFSVSHWFTEPTSQMCWFRWDSESCCVSDQYQNTKRQPWPLFGGSLALGSALQHLLSSATELVIASHWIKSTFHRTSQSDQELVHLLHKIREDDTSKWQCFDFQSAHQAPWASLVAQLVKNLPAMWETWVQSLGWEDPPGKGMATHSSILPWRIPWIV